MREPARAAKLAGGDVVLLPDIQFIPDPMLQEQIVDVVPPDVDVVVLQRPLGRGWAQIVPMLQAHGRAVVVEVDDDFLTLNPNNPAWIQNHPSADPERNWTWLRYAVRHADLVTVSTPALARRYSSDAERVRILRNCVPERYLQIGDRGFTDSLVRRNRCAAGGLRSPSPQAGLQVVPHLSSARRTELHSTKRVGWPGTPTYHPGDLEVCRGAVAVALERTGAVFVAIGGQRTAEILGIPPERAYYQPWTSLEDYPAAVARLDVGIAPLADTAFNAGKSSLKALEYSALSVPFVCSPSPEYVHLGAGVLAHNPRTWQRSLIRLVDDDAYAAEQRERNRAIAAEWTYERHAHEWIEAWETAWDRRMKASIRQARRALR